MKSICTLILILMALSSPKVMALDAEGAGIFGGFFRDIFGFSTETLWAREVQFYIATCALGADFCPPDDHAKKLGIDLEKFYSSDPVVRKKYIDELQDETTEAYKHARNLVGSSKAMAELLLEMSADRAGRKMKKAFKDAKQNPKP